MMKLGFTTTRARLSKSIKSSKKKSEATPVKAKSQMSADKMLAIILLIDFLHEHRIINAAYYCDHLVKLTYSQQTTWLSNKISHSSIWQRPAPHCRAHTQSTERNEKDTTEPYSPDLSPCDFHLFGPLKEPLGGKRFEDDAGVESFVRN